MMRLRRAGRGLLWPGRMAVAMINRRRLVLLAIAVVIAAPIWSRLTTMGWSAEQAVDIVTLLTASVMFLTIAGITVLLTEDWTPVGRALTAIAIILAILYAGTFVGVFYPALWPSAVKWIGRVALIWTCICVIDAMWVYVQRLRRGLTTPIEPITVTTERYSGPERRSNPYGRRIGDGLREVGDR